MAIYREPGRVVYTGDDRLEVEVLVHGDAGKEWVYGELRSWNQADDGNWSAMVSYRLGVAQQYLERFDQAAIRKAEDPVTDDA